MRPRLLLAVVVAVVVLGVGAFFVTRSAPETPGALPWASLRNATYPSELTRSKLAPLSDGLYEEDAAPGSASKVRVQIADIAGFGRLDADSTEDAAVVLIGSSGGSGTFIYLVAVMNDDGTANPAASVLLGDRVAVRAIRIEDRRIIVGMRVRGSTDPLALLTREVTRTYSYEDGRLDLLDEQARDALSTSPDQFAFETQRLAPDLGQPVMRKGTLPPGELAVYLVSAQAGVELRVSVKSQFNNAVLSIQGLQDGVQLLSRSEYATSVLRRVPETQDYAITVVTLAGNDLPFELTVEVRAAATPIPTAPPRSTVTPTIVPRPAATATPASGQGGTSRVVPQVLKGAFTPAQQPLSSLSVPATQFLDGRVPVWGVSMAWASGSVMYSTNGDAQLELASSVKLLIALAVMDAAQLEGRRVDRFELSLLWPMITLSDNDSATELWEQIGGGRGLAGYLSRIGASGIRPYDGQYWGTSTASANALSLLLARAVFGDLLGPEHRNLLITLLESVIPAQRWGVSAGAEGEATTGAIVGLKNGWYPAEAGWRVNSVGFVASQNGRVLYTLAVLTNNQPSLAYGIGTIEGVSGRVTQQIATATLTVSR